MRHVLRYHEFKVFFKEFHRWVDDGMGVSDLLCIHVVMLKAGVNLPPPCYWPAVREIVSIALASSPVLDGPSSCASVLALV